MLQRELYIKHLVLTPNKMVPLSVNTNISLMWLEPCVFKLIYLLNSNTPGFQTTTTVPPPDSSNSSSVTKDSSATHASPSMDKGNCLRQPSSCLKGYITNTVQILPTPVAYSTSPTPSTRSSGTPYSLAYYVNYGNFWETQICFGSYHCWQWTLLFFWTLSGSLFSFAMKFLMAIQTSYIHMGEQLADLLTKALGKS